MCVSVCVYVCIPTYFLPPPTKYFRILFSVIFLSSYFIQGLSAISNTYRMLWNKNPRRGKHVKPAVCSLPAVWADAQTIWRHSSLRRKSASEERQCLRNKTHAFKDWGRGSMPFGFFFSLSFLKFEILGKKHVSPRTPATSKSFFLQKFHSLGWSYWYDWKLPWALRSCGVFKPKGSCSLKIEVES